MTDIHANLTTARLSKMAMLTLFLISVIVVFMMNTTTAAQETKPAVPQAAPPTNTVISETVISEAEIKLLGETYVTLSKKQRKAMLAVYKDMGLDIEKQLEALVKASDQSTAGTPKRQLSNAVRRFKFARKPEDVLAARTRIGLNPESMPDEDADDKELASWLHRHVMAGEWEAFKTFLDERAGKDAQQIYSHIIQSTNQAKSELLPEDMLGLSEAAPDELTEWQIDTLAKLLKSAAAKSSTAPLLQSIKQGTTWFGPQTPEKRQRTTRLLLSAGLAVEAYDYMPSLDQARKDGDAGIIIGHARYQLARAKSTSGTEKDKLVRQAWELYGEVTLLDTAQFTQRNESLRLAIDLLPQIPPGPGLTWLRSVFKNQSLAAAGLEAVALKAMKIQDAKIPEQARAQAILTMKEAVDTLLEQESVQIEQLRVPLRMLTIGLIGRAESAISQNSNKKGVASVSALLLRAMPNERWRNTIEPSLATRAYKAFIGVALIADETDLALDLLGQAVARMPKQSQELASGFLQLWVKRLKARGMSNQSYSPFMFRSSSPSAPITRGWQRRNLNRLARLLDMLDKIGIDGRKLDSVVPAFAACHGRTETYQRKTLVRILGSIDQITPEVAASMAESMRSGLNGDWRDRKAQRDEGFKRSESELRAIIERGYDLAIELIDSAVVRGDEAAWNYSIIKASLAYDRMQFRGERDQDAAAYHTARKELFAAFQGAAGQYRAALARGDIRANPQLYFTWFSVSLGSSDLGALTIDDLLSEGAENVDQIDLIRSDIMKMTPDNAQFHFGEFARGIVGALPRIQPDVKPRLVQSAARIVGDHPAGSPLKRTLDLYNDLLKDEIQLNLAVDGSDRVGTQPFGAVLTLRYTATIDRASGGFAKYLQNQVYTYINGQYARVDYRDRLEKTIRESFGDSFEVLSIGFFESMNPAAPIRVKGESGWEEKPVAYMVLRATDPSVDHLPQVQMDLSFQDSSGPVVLPVRSNTVLLDASSESKSRPVKDVVIEQILDPRPMLTEQDPPVVKLEITAHACGVLPPIQSLLPQLSAALPGYKINEDGIESETMETGLDFLAQPEVKDKKTTGKEEKPNPYIEPDKDGLFRLGTTKTWTVTFTPTLGNKGDTFTFPDVAKGINAKITRSYYQDMDYIPIESTTLNLATGNSMLVLWIGLPLAVALGIITWLSLRRHDSEQGLEDDAAIHVPVNVTPLSAVVLLDRIERDHTLQLSPEDRTELRSQLETLQQCYFANNSNNGNDKIDIESVVRKWVSRCVSN